MSSFRSQFWNRVQQRRPTLRKRSPLRNMERLEDRIAPAISIVNLALSGGPISEDTTTLRTLSGALATPALTDVDLAIAWGDGSPVQHATLATGQTSFQLDHTFFFPE